MPYDPLDQLAYDSLAAVFEVHREQGGGLLEEIYQESLEHELDLRGLPFHSKQELPVFYKGKQLKKTYIPDLLVGSAILVELKAVKQLTTEHEAQLLYYMRITRMSVGYLVNFGPLHRAEWKRYVF